MKMRFLILLTLLGATLISITKLITAAQHFRANARKDSSCAMPSLESAAVARTPAPLAECARH
jgi:hypothetical protein